MSSVYFLNNFAALESEALKRFTGVYPENEEILVKIHFGEPGNKTALFPQDVAPIISALKKLNLKPTFIDTPVAYPSPRNNVAGYEQAVKDRGYDKLAPFIISDRFVEIKTKNLTVQVCKELTEAKNLLVISHVKGHPCAGFGAAIKNFGMGGMMVKSKNDIHNGSKPKMTGFCEGCGTCARLCPAKAIKVVNDVAQIDLDSCYGCSICQLSCPKKALSPQVAIFDDLLAQGATACINNLPKNTYYINILKNITMKCDCEENSGEIISPDVGVLFSDNPVAIDQASIDLVQKTNESNVFLSKNHKDPKLQVNYAAQYCDFKPDYQLTEI